MINFNPEDWEFERSSGYAGYRNTKTMDWVYADVYSKRLDMWTRHNGNILADKSPRYHALDMYKAYKRGIEQGQNPTTLPFDQWLIQYEQENYPV